jgi:hypothetical protein
LLVDWYLEKAVQCDALALTAANARQRTKLQIESRLWLQLAQLAAAEIRAHTLEGSWRIH